MQAVDPFGDIPRVDKAFLDPGLYPYSVELPVRYSDLDSNRHVNNVAMFALFEEARIQFGHHAGLKDALEGGHVVVGSQRLHYLAEARYGSPVLFSLAIGALGRNAWRFWTIGMQRNKCVTAGDASSIYIRDGRVSDLPEALRARFEPFRIRFPEPGLTGSGAV